MKHKHALSACLGRCVLAGTIATSMHSGSHSYSANTWDGGAADGNWSSLPNWDDNQLPNFPTGVTFSGNANLATLNDLNGLTLGGITFDVSAGPFVIEGNAVTLNGNITSNAFFEQTIQVPVVLGAATNVTVAEAGFVTIAAGENGTGIVSGGFDLFKSGLGTLILGSANTYTGNTVMDGGSLRYTADNVGVRSLIFGATVSSPNVSFLELAGANVTATELVFQTNSTLANTVAVGADKSLTINGAMTVGANVAGLAQPGVVTIANFTGGGSLLVNGGTNHLSIGMPRGNGDAGPDPNAALDLSGLSNFAYLATTGELRVGAGNAVGTLRLANTSNIITAAQVRVGDSGIQAPAPNNGNNNGGTSRLVLGSGTNVIQTNTIIVGAVKSPAVFSFETSEGSVQIAGISGGTSRANITIGTASSATGSNTTSQFQLAGHNAAVQAGTVLIGQLSGGNAGAGNGSLTFDTGTFDVNNLVLATHSSGEAINGTTGTFELGGAFPNETATGVLNVNNQFLLANRTATANPRSVTGNFTINGGTANINADILIVDSSPGAAPRLTSLTLAAGTLNMMGHSIATAALPIDTINLPGFGQTATLTNLGGTGVNGAGLTFTNGGTLILDGTNSYSGPTTITGSTLQVGTGGETGTLGSGPIINDGSLTFNRAGRLTVPGGISGAGGLEKSGAGSVILAGANSYTGATMINEGTLSLTGSVGEVTLAPGARMHTGFGGLSGTLEMNSLMVNGGDLQFEFTAPGTLMTVAGAAIFAAPSTLTPNPAVSSGTHTLIAAGALTLGTSPTLVAPTGTRKTFALDFSTANAIKLVVTGASKALNWTGTLNGTWDLGASGAANWNDGAINETYFDADSVTFGDGPANRTVTISELTVRPASVVVNNSLGNDYSIGGSGGIGGSTEIVKDGSGPLSLATANTHTGGTTLNGGTLNINHASALGSGVLTITGGALDNTSGGPLVITQNNPQHWAADFSFGGTSALDLGTGTVTLLADRTVTIAGGALTIGGSIEGAFGLTKIGPGTLVITGSNAAVTTNIAAGTLQVGNGGTTGTLSGGMVINSGILAFNRSDNFAVNAVLDGAGEFIKLGAGILTVAGVNTYSGPTLINAGTIRVTNAAAGNSSLGSLSGGTVTIPAGAALDLGGNLTAQALNFGSKEFRIAGAGPDGVGAIVNYGVSQFNALQQVVLTENATIGGPQRFDIRSVPTSALNARLDLAGNTLTKSGANQFSLVGVDVSDGNIIVNQGVFAIETVTKIPDFGTGTKITMQAGTTLQFFNATASPSAVQRPIVFEGSGSQIGNANNVISVLGSPILLNGELTVNALNNANATSGLRLEGSITETGARSITKNGPSQLILAGNNSYSGGTIINAGTVQMQSLTALGAPTAPLTVNTGGSLDLFGNHLTVGSLSGGNGMITNTAGSAIVLTVGDANDTTFSGVIQDAGASINFTKQGSGALTLTGLQAYTGITNVNAGVLEVNGSISGAIAVNGGVLAGTGVVGAVSLSSGGLAPGGTAGILSTGSLGLNGGRLDAEIAGLLPGNGLGFHDQINVTGSVSFAGPVTLTLDFSTFDPFDSVDSFVLIKNDDVDLVTFADSAARLFFGATRLDEGTVFTATSGPFTQAFSITYAGGSSGNDVVLHAIPEPASMLTLLAGLGVLSTARRRRAPNNSLA